MDRAAFETEALSHLDAVYRHALHLTHRPSEAEEIVQEVYSRALRPSSVAAFQPTGGGMRSWLLAICHNVFFSARRAASRNGVPSTAGIERTSAEPMPDEGPPAWDRATMRWEQVDATLKRAIEQLSPEYREVLLMWGVEGLKYREIAAILAVPIGTVMSRLHRARQIVAVELAKDGFARHSRTRGALDEAQAKPLPG
jgi:RNA polymerase sigma-70 factor (ECF subfamily)